MTRIISLLASGTEMVAALGAIESLVGRSHECDWPPQVRELPVLSHVQINLDVSSAKIDAQIKALSGAAQGTATAALSALSPYRIDIALLQALRPDVIITQTQCDVCAVSERDVTDALRTVTGCKPTIVALAPHRLTDVWDDLRSVGTAIGKADEAEQCVARYEARLATLAARALVTRPRVAFLEWADPLMGAGNWMPELIRLAGGEPVFGEIGQHSPWLSWDELAAADPEIIVIAPCGYTLAHTMQHDMPLLRSQSAWNGLQAVRNGRIAVADGNAFFNRSGPRLVESAEIIAAIITGGDAHNGWWQWVEPHASQ